MKLSLDFAFEGFRIIRHRPLVIPIWGVFLLIGFGLAYGLFFSMAWQPFMAFIQQMQASAGQAPDPMAMLQFYGKIGPAYLVMLLVSLVVQSIMACAVYRVVLGRPETSFGGLRFGGDELRQMLAGFLFFLLFIAIEIAWEIAGLVVGGILTVVLAMVSPKLVVVGSIITAVVIFGGIFWTVAKLSLFGPQTFDEKKLNLFGSWKLTKGNSGTLLIGYVVAAVLMLLVEILCLVIFVVVVYAITGGHIVPPTPGPDMAKQLMGLAIPVLVAFGVLMLVLMPLMMAIFIGAPAAAYRTLAGVKAKSPEAVF